MRTAVHDACTMICAPPWQRITDGQYVPDTKLQELKRFMATNPLALRAELDQALETLFRMPNAPPGQTQDIFQTLIDIPIT